MNGHKCLICLGSRSESRPPSKPANEDWCALTSCGHVLHLSCTQQWVRSTTDPDKLCPLGCASLDVKRKKARGGALTESLPYLRIFLDAPDPPGAPSSDAVDMDDVKPRLTRRNKGKGKGKGKARAIPDDEEEDEEDEQASEDATAAGQDEVKRLRRERAELHDTARTQREHIKRLEAELRRSAVAPPVPVQTEGRSVVAPAPAYASTSGAVGQVRSRYFSSIAPAPPRDPLRPDRTTWRDDCYDDDDDDEMRCGSCGHGHGCYDECLGPSVHEVQDELEEAHEELARLRATARANDPQAVAALAAQLRALQTRFDELRDKSDELQARYDELVRERDELVNDHHEARIKWEEEMRRLKDKLRTSGASGEEVIRQLGQEIDEKDHEIFLLKAAQDGHKLRADAACKAADEIAAKARQESLAVQAEAQQRIKVEKDKAAEDHDIRKRFERAHQDTLQRYKKLKKKLKDLQTKRGILATDSDDDAVSAPQASTSAATVSHKRSRTSLSPDQAGPAAFRINNNSRLLASPTKRAHSRTPVDPCDISLETDPVEYADADDDDDLEYVDAPRLIEEAEEEGVQHRGDEVENRPPVGLESDSSDVEIVESSFFARPASSSAPARPLAARGSAVNAFPTASASSSKKRAFGLTTLVEGSSRASSSSGSGWAPKKPALSQARSDKYLPDFASSRAAATTGPKHRIKRK
ncbi:hypothetical protein DMC30DRAFT_21007 [Rhodotorula diobovata]|uniref:RING-type domain-containing protein n=1 Tax=Rhodotorula diobovata TaxID=5288 RepID=A0A5C5G2W8_9BASI|nr:hypothetical protein DMC30DRAFT_21007 [Rhodotorula diobovata]